MTRQLKLLNVKRKQDIIEKVMIYPNTRVGKFIFRKSFENTEHLFSKSRRIIIDKKDENIVKVYDGVLRNRKQ